PGDVVVVIAVVQLLDDPRRADVGALGDDAGGVDHAQVAVVGGAVATVRDPARVGVEDRPRGDDAGFKAGGHGDRLDRGTRFDQVGDRAVAAGIAVLAGDRVGVVGR